MFGSRPKVLEEAFITLEEARVSSGRKSVRIGPKTSGVTIRATMPGRFRVERLVEASKEGRTDDVISRITFVPARLQKTMKLSFEVE